MHSFSDIRRQKCCDLAIRVRGHSRSYELTPIDHYDDQSATCDFLHEPISRRLRDKRRFPSKIANFSHPRVLNAPAVGVPLGIGTKATCQKTRMMVLLDGQKVLRQV